MGGSGFQYSLGGVNKRSAMKPKLAFGLGAAKPKLPVAFAEDSDSDGEGAAKPAAQQRTGCTGCHHVECSHVCGCCSSRVRRSSATSATGLSNPRPYLTLSISCCCSRGRPRRCGAAAAAALGSRGAKGGGQAGGICGEERALL